MQRMDRDLAEVNKIKYSDYSQQPQIYTYDSRNLARFVPSEHVQFQEADGKLFHSGAATASASIRFSFLFLLLLLRLTLLESNIFSHSSEGGGEE